MAGVVIRRDGTDFSLRPHKPQLTEKLVHIADLRRPSPALDLLAVVPVVAVILQHRTATGNVINDCVEPLDGKCVKVIVGELACWLARSGMKMNCAAAN